MTLLSMILVRTGGLKPFFDVKRFLNVLSGDLGVVENDVIDVELPHLREVVNFKLKKNFQDEIGFVINVRCRSILGRQIWHRGQLRRSGR